MAPGYLWLKWVGCCWLCCWWAVAPTGSPGCCELLVSCGSHWVSWVELMISCGSHWMIISCSPGFCGLSCWWAVAPNEWLSLAHLGVVGWAVDELWLLVISGSPGCCWLSGWWAVSPTGWLSLAHLGAVGWAVDELCLLLDGYLWLTWVLLAERLMSCGSHWMAMVPTLVAPTATRQKYPYLPHKKISRRWVMKFLIISFWNKYVHGRLKCGKIN